MIYFIFRWTSLFAFLLLRLTLLFMKQYMKLQSPAIDVRVHREQRTGKRNPFAALTFCPCSTTELIITLL